MKLYQKGIAKDIFLVYYAYNLLGTQKNIFLIKSDVNLNNFP